MSAAVFVGIDPGVTGAIAVLNANRQLLALHDMPTQATTTGRKEINPAALADIMRQWPGARVTVERVGPRPGEGAVGAFAFGHSFGAVLAVLATLGHPTRLVQPAVWKRWASIPPGAPKEAAVAVAGRLVPSAAPSLTLKKHHGRADAVLLATFGEAHA
jgi:crossover junction endodeoxyribonuclease RuvC